MNETVLHYDRLVDEGNDPFRDPEPLRTYMDSWDGQVFIDALCLDKEKTVFEIGVGTGRLAARVSLLCRRLVGIDFSPKTVARAKENLSDFQNTEIICEDFLRYETSERFDVIYSSLTFMHIKNKSTAYKKVTSLLKDGGRFVLSIDKSTDTFLDYGTRRIELFPDDKEMTHVLLKEAGLSVRKIIETEHAYIFVAIL